MKINCEACQAKYTIADEKVAGKIVKIKCKKCATTIVVNGNDVGAAGAAGENDGATRVFAEAGHGGDDEWTVNVTDTDQRTMTAAQVAQELAAGAITLDTYVWRDGMPDWLPLGEIPQLMAEIETSGSTRAMPKATLAGAGGTVVMEERALAPSPLVARAGAPPPAARRPSSRGGVDLFGATAKAEPSAAPAADPASAERLVGARNESSVLFSLSALTAAENAARAQSKDDDDAAAGSRRSGRPPRNNDRAGLDDIMNLGGSFGSAMGGSLLTAPPLLAPVIEPPQSQPAPAMVSATPLAPVSATSKAGLPVGLLVAISIAVAAVAAVAVLLLRGAAPPQAADPSQATAPVETAASAAAPTAIPAEIPAVAQEGSAAPTAVAAVSAAVEPGKPASQAAPGAQTSPAQASPGAHAARSDAAPRNQPKPDPKPVEAAPPSEGSREFNRGAATSALGAAAGAARGCKKPDGPTGSGRVRITFAPSGNVTSASVQGPPFAGTAVGGCVASAFRTAKVPPFDGSPVSVTKSFSIN